MLKKFERQTLNVKIRKVEGSIMGLTKLSKKCRTCPFVTKCENKRMEAVAYLPDPMLAPATQPLTEQATMPIARKVVERHAYGQVFYQYEDEIKKELEKELYSHLYKGLNCNF